MHFHYWGLQSSLTGCRSSQQRATSVYGGLGGDLISLSQIKQRLGHEGRTIGAFKIDCEGCEWDAFYQMSRTEPAALDDVAVIMIEVHQVRQLKMDTAEDLRKFQAFFEYVIVQQGFRFFFHHNNMGLPYPKYTLHPLMARLGAFAAGPGRCCFEIGLAKPSLVAKVLSDT